MSQPQPSLATTPQVSALSRIVPDRRRHKRVALQLLGRFMHVQSKREYPCKLIDISVGGAAIQSPHLVQEEERIVAYFDEIGRLEGIVVRRFEAGFAFEIVATRHKREKLAATLTWLANRNVLNLPEGRRHERIIPKHNQSLLRFADGSVVNCRLLDISVSGASVAVDVRPHIGEELVLGRLRARVVRHHEHGLGLEFIDIQNANALRRYFG